MGQRLWLESSESLQLTLPMAWDLNWGSQLDYLDILPQMIQVFLLCGDWVPRVSILKSEAQGENISPFVNQPWKSRSITFAVFYLSRPPTGLSDFKARRKRFYFLVGKWLDSKRAGGTRNIVMVIFEKCNLSQLLHGICGDLNCTRTKMIFYW